MANGYEIVGWAPYAGDSPEVSGYDIVGQAKAAAARPMLPLAALAGLGPGNAAPQAPPGMMPVWGPAALPPRPTVMQSASPSEMRRQVLPVGNQSIPAGGTVTFQTIPQRPFRCERLVITHAGAPGDVLVNDVRVGATPQFVAAGSVSAEVFQATAVGSSLRGDTAQPGITVSVQVQNTSAGPLTVNAAIIGEALE